jgi:hypothetical protein
MTKDKNEVSKLSAQSGEDEILSLQNEDLEVPDLTGEHEAVITYFEKKKSKNGNPYFSLGVQVTSGPGEGEGVFGRVFPGRSLRFLLELIGVDPSKSKQLRKEDIIGKAVKIRVQESEMDGIGGSKVYEISKFLRQTIPAEEPKELF